MRLLAMATFKQARASILLSFGLDGHSAPNDGVDAVGWLDVLVTGIYVFIIVVLVTLLPCVVRLVRFIQNLLARVDGFENTTILHGMV
jgi:hypothetical protein